MGRESKLGLEAPWRSVDAALVERLVAAIDDKDRQALDLLLEAEPRAGELRPRVERLYGAVTNAARSGIPTLPSRPAAPTSSSIHFRSGDLVEVPGYKLGKELGRGGMGVVFEALELQTTRHVALKVIPACDGQATEERFRREVAALGRIKSPHVVTLYSCGTVGGVFHYSMELLSGEAFDATLRRWRSKPDKERFQQAADVIAQAAAGAAVIHAAEILHRDLKPSNIFVLAEGTVKLIDFGLVRVLGDETITRTGALVGSIAYMSPEHLLGGARPLDKRSDVYSLGVALYEACALQLPFQSTWESAVGRVSESSWTPVLTAEPGIPQDLAAIIEKACAFHPEDRYADASGLAADLRAFQAGAPVSARLLGRWGRLARRARRHRRRLAVLCTGVVILFTAMIGLNLWIQRSRKADSVARAVEVAERAAADHRTIVDRLPAVRDLAESASAEVNENVPFANRRTSLEALDQLERLQAEEVRAFDAALLAAQRGLEESPGHPRLQKLVETLAWERLLDAEREGLPQEIERMQGLLQSYAPHLMPQLNATARLTVTTNPPGARVYFYRYETSSPFLLPVPYAPGRGLLMKEKELPPPRMVVTRDPDPELQELGLHRGDRIVSINGHAVDITGNRCLRRVLDEKRSTVEVERGGQRFTLRLVEEYPGYESYWKLLNNCISAEAFPLTFPSGGSSGETPLPEIELPAGSYLVVLELGGQRMVRVPIRLERDDRRTLPVNLPLTDDPGEEWAYIPTGPVELGGDRLAHNPEVRRTAAIDDYFILRREVTVREYFRFLNDLEIRAEIAAMEAAGDDSPLLPVDLKAGGKPVYFRRTTDAGVEFASTGVEIMQRYLPRSACERYVAWLNDHERRTGGSFDYALPSSDELEKAARGADGRAFPWGNRFDLGLVTSSRSTGRPDFRNLAFATDSSPYDVRDLAGSLREWTRDTEPPPISSPSYFELREARVKGGSYLGALTSDFRMGGHTREKVKDGYQDVGFRVVARLRRPGYSTGEVHPASPREVRPISEQGLAYNPDPYAVPRWFVDVNGDGFVDYCRLQGAEPPIGDGVSIECAVSEGTVNLGPQVSLRGVALGEADAQWFSDIDGDRRADFVRLFPEGASHVLLTLRSVRQLFDDELVSPAIDAGLAGNRWFADVDGDGCNDFCYRGKMPLDSLKWRPNRAEPPVF